MSLSGWRWVCLLFGHLQGTGKFIVVGLPLDHLISLECINSAIIACLRLFTILTFSGRFISVQFWKMIALIRRVWLRSPGRARFLTPIVSWKDGCQDLFPLTRTYIITNISHAIKSLLYQLPARASHSISFVYWIGHQTLPGYPTRYFA